MKITKQPDKFNPVTVVIETHRELITFWGMARHAALTTEQDEVLRMAVQISDWISAEEHV